MRPAARVPDRAALKRKSTDENAQPSNSLHPSSASSLAKRPKAVAGYVPKTGPLPRYSHSSHAVAAKVDSGRTNISSAVAAPTSMYSNNTTTAATANSTASSSLLSSGSKRSAAATAACTPTKSAPLSPASRLAGSRGGQTPSSTSKSKLNNTTKSTLQFMIPVEPPTLERMKMLFEEGMSVPADRAQVIMAPILNPRKNDFKEKQKRYELAVRELKESIVTVLTDLSSLKQRAVAHEAYLNGQIKDYHSHIAEYSRRAFSLSDNEGRYKSDIHKLRLENDKIDHRISEFVYEKARLQEILDEHDRRFKEIENRRLNEEALKAEAQNRILFLEKEIISAKREAVEAARATKDACTEKYNHALSAYREEAAQLRQEVLRRQHETEKGMSERVEIDKRANLLREQMRRLQNSIKEAENTASRNAEEIEALSTELAKAEEHVAKKDAELRESLARLSELQKHCAAENGLVRVEASQLQQRIHALETERASLISSINGLKDETHGSSRDIIALREQIKGLDELLLVKDEELKIVAMLRDELSQAKDDRALCEQREEEERMERIEACNLLKTSQVECEKMLVDIEANMTHQIETVRSELLSLVGHRDDLMRENSHNKDSIVSLTSEISQLEDALGNKSTTQEAEQRLRELLQEVENAKREYEAAMAEKEKEKNMYNSQVSIFEEQLKQGDLQRRKLQNTIQELRGSARVFARIRPYIESIDGSDASENKDAVLTIKTDDPNCVQMKHFEEEPIEPASMEVETEAPKPSFDFFNFDKVFSNTSSQEHIYKDVSELVQSSIEGFNVCIIAYGESNSGKTHTLQGCGNELNKGIIPRAVEQALRYKQEIEKNKDWSYRVDVSYFEINKETIRDLLRNSQADNLNHEIKADYFVSDLQRVSIDSLEKIDEVMSHAARRRSVSYNDGASLSSSSNMNTSFSCMGCSHSIFTLHLSALNVNHGESLDGTLVFVDLVGSDESDDVSLAALGEVFKAIESKQAHVPYKSSKLTHYLQPTLSQSGKILMMLTLSPTEDSFEQTLKSLKFAEMVKRCELGKPKPKKQVIALPKDKEASTNRLATARPASSFAGKPVMSRFTRK